MNLHTYIETLISHDEIEMAIEKLLSLPENEERDGIIVQSSNLAALAKRESFLSNDEYLRERKKIGYFLLQNIKNIPNIDVDWELPTWDEPEIAQDSSFVDKTMAFVKKNKITASILLLATFIIGLGSVTDSIEKIQHFIGIKKDSVAKTEKVLPTIDSGKKVVQENPKTPVKEEKPQVQIKKPHKDVVINPNALKEITKEKEKINIPIERVKSDNLQVYTVIIVLNDASEVKDSDILIDGRPANVIGSFGNSKKVSLKAGEHSFKLENTEIKRVIKSDNQRVGLEK